jgi:hypothetical protein
MRLPQFRPVKGAEIAPGDRLYLWKVGPDLWLYVMLGIFHLEDLMFLELAWTSNKRWPARRYSQDPFGPAQEGSVRFRLYELWNEREPLDLWRIGPRVTLDPVRMQFTQPSPEQDLFDEIESVVSDSIDRLVRFGLPYFQKVAREHGYNLAEVAQ